MLAAASGMGIVLLGSNAAHAAGTTVGATITNTVTVNYQVGGVSQSVINASDTFTVDRKINLTVAEIGSTTTSVSPGQTAAVTAFTVTNTSNDVLDFGLAATQATGGAAPHGGTDNFNATAPALYRDTNSNGTYEAGTDTAVAYLDELAADASQVVFVVANIPMGQVNGDKATVILTATAREGGGASSQGAAVTETAGANTAAEDTVFADAAGSDDAARSGTHSARDDYTVSAALLTVTKTSRVISDPLNGATNPKLIPGAVVEYCISVANGAGAATATNIAISDPVPANTVFVASSIMINTTVAGGVCSGGAAGGGFGANTVSGTLTDIPASTTRGLRFQVTIN